MPVSPSVSGWLLLGLAEFVPLYRPACTGYIPFRELDIVHLPRTLLHVVLISLSHGKHQTMATVTIHIVMVTVVTSVVTVSQKLDKLYLL